MRVIIEYEQSDIETLEKLLSCTKYDLADQLKGFQDEISVIEKRLVELFDFVDDISPKGNVVPILPHINLY